MPRSNLVNAVDVALADPVGGADPTIRVTSPELLPPIPFYLVVDPFNITTGREYMFATAILGDVLTVTRNLDGTESTTHDAGDIVRITYVAQQLHDLWDSIEANDPAGVYLPLAGGTLVGQLIIQYDSATMAIRGVTSSPNMTLRRMAGMNNDTDGQLSRWDDKLWFGYGGSASTGQHIAVYDNGEVRINAGVDGAASAAFRVLATHESDFYTNRLVNVGTPTDPTDGATKGYADSLDHDHATPIAAHAAIEAAHHARYTDAEADARAVLQDHDHATPIAAHTGVVSAHHVKYTDSEAITAVGPHLTESEGHIITTIEPVNPEIGTVWVDPSAGGEYFPIIETWIPTMPGVTIGNGEVIGIYQLVGKVCWFWFSFRLGTSSTIDGDVSFSLPLDAAMPSSYVGVAYNQIGIGAHRRENQRTYVAAAALEVASPPTASIRVLDMAGDINESLRFVSTTSVRPFVWVATDSMQIMGSYQVV